MKTAKITAWFVSTCFLAIATPSHANESSNVVEQKPTEQHLQEVVSRLVGIMSTSAQARANSESPDVQITTCQVRVEDATSANAEAPVTYLYQEQAMRSRLSEPYRQRFLRIGLSEDTQSIESAGFQPDNPQSWIGLCDRPETERTLQQSDLGQYRCSVFLKPAGEDYIGETPESGCPAHYRGAVRITNTVVLHPDGMETWDRGFDADGNQLWGANEKPYQYRKIDPEQQESGN